MPPSDEANEIVLSLSDNFLAKLIERKKQGTGYFKYIQHTSFEPKITHITHTLEELMVIQTERKLDGK